MENEKKLGLIDLELRLREEREEIDKIKKMSYKELIQYKKEVLKHIEMPFI